MKDVKQIWSYKTFKLEVSSRVYLCEDLSLLHCDFLNYLLLLQNVLTFRVLAFEYLKDNFRLTELLNQSK